MQDEIPWREQEAREEARRQRKKAKRLEAALREIERLATCPIASLMPRTALGAVANKCREALTTGEGE